MSDDGFSYVGTITSVEQVKRRNGEVLEGLYHVHCKGHGPDHGDDRKLSVNSHAKAENGGGINPYWTVITTNQATGVPVQFKGWKKEDADGWGNNKVYWNANGARLWAADGSPPAQQAAAPAVGGNATGGNQPAPAAEGTLYLPDLRRVLAEAMVPLEHIAAVAAVLPTMPAEVEAMEGKVRGAWLRNHAAKVISLARLLARDGAGPDWEEVAKNTTWKDAEEPMSAPAPIPEEPAVQQAPPPQQAAPPAEQAPPSEGGW